MNNNLAELDVPALRALLGMKQQAMADAETAGQPHETVYKLYQELKAIQVELTMRNVQAPVLSQ
ncbi:MAG: hypothetical protein EOO16_07275 [Chitinophagaceae bacterium]|nr:MAG: hypothetical protein EOO16_07275 [Chitinophagaceae bacterium]